MFFPYLFFSSLHETWCPLSSNSMRKYPVLLWFALMSLKGWRKRPGSSLSIALESVEPQVRGLVEVRPLAACF